MDIAERFCHTKHCQAVLHTSLAYWKSSSAVNLRRKSASQRYVLICCMTQKCVNFFLFCCSYWRMNQCGFCLFHIWWIFVLVCLQLDEKVREWQDSSLTASRCFWVTEQAGWAELIPSAVRFLADGILGKLSFILSYFFFWVANGAAVAQWIVCWTLIRVWFPLTPTSCRWHQERHPAKTNPVLHS